MKKLLLFTICIAICFSFCSCNSSVNTEITSDINSDASVLSNNIYYTKNNVIIKSIGDVIHDYAIFKDPVLNVSSECGRKGLYYTLKNVTVYKSITHAGLSYEDTNAELSKEELEKYPFILVDIGIEYKANEAELNRLETYMSLLEMSFETDKYEEMPSFVYFSHHKEGTVNDFLADNSEYAYYEILKGQKIEAKIGIVAGIECIERKDVYLTPHPAGRKIDDFTPECFKLITDNTVYAETITQ